MIDWFDSDLGKIGDEKPRYSITDLKERLYRYISEEGRSNFVIDHPDMELDARVFFIYSPCLVTMKKDSNSTFVRDYKEIDRLFVD